MAKKKQEANRTSRDGEPHLANRRRGMLRVSVALALAGVLALGWISFITHDPADWPGTQVWPQAQPVHNYAGVVGASFSHYAFTWLGSGAYMALLFGSVATGLLLSGSPIRDLGFRVIGVTLLVTCTSTACWLARPYAPGQGLFGRGGVLGTACGTVIRDHFGRFGWAIVLVTGMVALVLAADSLVLKIPHIGRGLWKRRNRLTSMASSLKVIATPRLKPAVAQPPSTGIAIARNTQPGATVRQKPSRVRISELPKLSETEPDRVPAGKAKDNPDSAPAERESTAALQARLKGLLTAVKPPAPAAPKPAPMKRPNRHRNTGEYELPGEDLLIDAEGGYMKAQEGQIELKRAVLQQTLEDFGVDARVVGFMTGPVITMFELSVAPGVKVSQIANLANDIARALAAPGVRIVSPIPGKDTIGIEVPNAQKEIVRIKELMHLAPDAARKFRLPLYLGKDAGGDSIVADLASMPHMLIAGTTGSGKSVCINSIIMSLLLTRGPRDVRLILMDPKMVEMAAFEKTPHLLCPIVNDMRKAESILEWAATKMDERYELLKEAGVKNITQFNKLDPSDRYARMGAETDEEKALIQTKIPYYVIIVDELADLIMTSSKDLENHIIRIAQKARAVGIHLLLATQRPSVNVVTGLIKSNMPCRISFRVASRQESRIVLDQNGAEVLLGQGDMLFLQPGTSSLIRAQGTFIDDGEIRAVTRFVRGGGGEPEYNDELVAIKPAGFEDAGGEGGRDEMFDQAVEIILQTQRGSVSLLQRRLGVGYSRASRIVDQMAEAGILGDYKGSQARECMMTLEDWRTLKAGIEADQAGENALNGEPTSV